MTVTTTQVNDLDTGYLSDEELIAALQVNDVSNPGSDLSAGEFGYEFYIAAPARARNRCVDAHLIPEGAWGIYLFEDGGVRSWETQEGTQFSQRGQQWFNAINAIHDAHAESRRQQRVEVSGNTYELELDWRDRLNASK